MSRSVPELDRLASAPANHRVLGLFGPEQLLLSALAIAVTFGDVFIQELHGIAAFYASLAREMLDSGELLAIFKGEHAYLLKPPLPFWLSAVSSAIFGINTFAVTLPTRLAGLGCVLITYLLARRLYGQTGAWFAALVLVTNGIYIQFTTTFRLDPEMTFGALMALIGYLELHRRWGPPAFFGGLAIAVMTKGPMALIILLMLPLHAWLRGGWCRPPARAAGWSALLLLPAGWYGYLLLEHGDAVVRELAGDFLLADTAVGLSSVESGLLEYLYKPLRRLWPWLPFMCVAIAVAFRDCLSHRFARAFRTDLALILGLFILNYVIAIIKPEPDVRYLYPSLPLLAVLTGGLLARLCKNELPRWLLRTTLGVLLLVALYIFFLRETKVDDVRGLAEIRQLAAAGIVAPRNTAILADMLPRLDGPKRADPVPDSVHFYLGFKPVSLLRPDYLAALPLAYRYFLLYRRQTAEQQLVAMGLRTVARSGKLLLMERGDMALTLPATLSDRVRTLEPSD